MKITVEEAKIKIKELEKIISDSEESINLDCFWRHSYNLHYDGKTLEKQFCPIHTHFRHKILDRYTKVIIEDWVKDPIGDNLGENKY